MAKEVDCRRLSQASFLPFVLSFSPNCGVLESWPSLKMCGT